MCDMRNDDDMCATMQTAAMCGERDNVISAQHMMQLIMLVVTIYVRYIPFGQIITARGM